MSLRLEHDYIGLSEVSSMEKPNDKQQDYYNNNTSLKHTELRLGLPGSESPDRRDVHVHVNNVGVDLSLGVLKNFMTGAKRGFSDALDASSKNWGFSGNGGSDVDVVFSPRGGNKSLEQSGSVANAMKVKDAVVPSSPKPVQEKKPQISSAHDQSPPTKSQVVGWPPIRSFRKNTMAANPAKTNNEEESKQGSGCLFVKVSMDGAPYLRKVDLKTYSNYMELSAALEKMFSCFTIGQCGSHGVGGRDGLSESRLMDLLHGSECVLTYEDKDGDWMLVGDVPWDMFIDSCKRLRIMKGSEAIGLAPRAMEKCKNRN